MARLGGPFGALALAVLLSTSAGTAFADTQECVAASEKAQQLKNTGKLVEAREHLVTCQRSDCPKLIRQDCTQWMAELLNNLPSIIPGARDKRGRDLVDVRVIVDGKVLAETLDGKPITIDPGVHTFRFEAKGSPPVEEQVVVKQGEKNRIYAVTFATDEDLKTLPPSSPSPSPPPPVTKPPSVAPKSGSAPVLGYVLGAAGLIAGGVALYVFFDADADARNLRETCAPGCAQGDVDDIESRRVIAAVTGGTGGALLIAGVLLILTHRSSAAATTKAPFVIAPAPGGGTAIFRF